MESIATILGARIRSYRKSQSLSQEVLAEMADLHPTYLGQIERGEKNATIESVQKISTALNIPMFTLFSTIQNLENDSQSYPQDRILQLLSTLNAKEQTIIYEMILTALKLK